MVETPVNAVRSCGAATMRRWGRPRIIWSEIEACVRAALSRVALGSQPFENRDNVSMTSRIAYFRLMDTTHQCIKLGKARTNAVFN
jgi:hypothetical protein